jgi:hypothetical protein
VALSTVRPQDVGTWAEDLAEADSPDLIVLDGTVPATVTLPASNLFYIAPPRSTPHFSVTGTVASPVPRIVNPADPLVAHIRVDEVSIMEAARMSQPLWARTVIAAEGKGEQIPLLFLGEHGGQRVAALSFDLRRSDLPLQVAFPLLLSNLVDWLVPSGSGGVPSQVESGATVSFLVSPEVGEVVVYEPDGAIARLEPAEGRVVFAETRQLGVYRAAIGDDEARFAVNLVAPAESDVAPAASLPAQGMDAAGGEGSLRSRREWWRPLGYAALCLLVIEWIVYQRSALARVVSWVRESVSRRRAV